MGVSGSSERSNSKIKRSHQLKVVEEARAQSRAEEAALEQMKQEARKEFLRNLNATEMEFERCWPKLRDDIFRRRALHATAK